MICRSRIIFLGALFLNSACAELVEPQIEQMPPWEEGVVFTDKEMARIKAGFPAPVFSTFYRTFATMANSRVWNDETHAMSWISLMSKWYFLWLPTSPSLREIPPRFSTVEGMRILRMSKSPECQVQTGYTVMNMEKIKLGWSITVWNADDTIPAPEKGWRVPISNREFQQKFELTEVKFDTAKRLREVQTRVFIKGQEARVFREMQSETGKRSQAITEEYRGSEIVPEKMISKSILQRIALPDFQFEQIITKEKLGQDAKWQSTQKTEKWQVEPDGRRHLIIVEKSEN